MCMHLHTTSRMNKNEAIINYERKVIKKPFIQCKLFTKKRPLNLSRTRLDHESCIIALVAINLHFVYTLHRWSNYKFAYEGDDWKIILKKLKIYK